MSGARLTPDLDMARRHLTLMGEEAETFVFQTIDDSKRKDPTLARVLHGTLDEHKAELARAQSRGLGVFVTVNISKNGRRRKEDIAAYRAVWREADEPNLPTLPLEPHFVIETSPGHKHEYLVLEPSDDMDTGDAIMERMVEDYGSCPGAKDRARVLRLAGFYHLKNPAKPHLVKIIHEGGGLPYTLEKVVAAIPPLIKKTKTAPPVIGEIIEGQRNSTLTSLAGSMRRRNMSEGAILAALTVENREKCCPPLPESELMTIAKSVSKYEPADAPTTEAKTTNPGEVADAPALTPVSLANLKHAELVPAKFAVDQLVPLNEVTLLGGHGGTGKSLLALIWAAHKAAGRAWFGFVAPAGRVVFISLEDPAPVVLYRVKKICEVYGLPYELIIQNLIILDGSDIDGTLAVETSDFGVRNISMTPLFDKVVGACEGAGLVFIDNTSDGYGGNEIDRRQVRAFIREVRNKIARPNNAGVVLLAHIDKAGARGGTNENTYSGSTAWHNSARSRFALTAKKDGVELVQEKLNLGKKLDRPIPLTWVDGVLTPSTDFAEGLVSEAQEDLDKIAVLTAIRKAISDGADIPTARTGPKTAQGVLERYPDLPSHLKVRKGREAFYGALTTLQREGVLTVEEYVTNSRNTRQRFCVNSNVHTYTPVPPCVELTKLTQGVSLVAGIALKAGTNETNETNAGEDLIL